MNTHPPASKVTACGGLLALSNEVLEQIILHLHPREAIFLSLTCRFLYHGVLSAKNHYLWYRVGPFARQIPGYKSEWEKIGHYIRSDRLRCKYADRCEPARVCTIKVPKTTAPWSRFPKQRLFALVKIFKPDEVEVDYKRMLLETMLRDTDSGCQWCLEDPWASTIYGNLDLRLCLGCLRRNIISVRKCKTSLVLKDIDISHLPIRVVTLRPPLNTTLKGVWGPSLQRLVAAKTTKSISELISESEAASKLAEDKEAK